jgi:hypothetical protein
MTDVSFSISGDNTGWLKAISESKAAAVEAKEQIQSQFESVSGVFEKITSALGLFTAALAGGAAFKEVIEKTVELTTDAINLGRQFGISAAEASVLKVALGDVFVTQEQLSTAGNAVTRTLREHEDVLKDLGVATRDQNGNYRNTLDVIIDVNEKLSQLKEGTDRNVEGQRIYSRAWGEIAPTIRLTAEAMEEAQTRAEELGLVIGTEDVEANMRYRRAMNDSKDVTEAAAKAIGDELLPVLSSMSESVNESGSDIVAFFRYVGAAVVTIYEGLRNGAVVIYEAIRMVVQGFWDLFSGFANAVARLLVFDFSGAKAAWKQGWDDLSRMGDDALDKIAKSSEAANERIINAWAKASGAPDVNSNLGPRPTGEAATDADPKKSRVAEWQATLDEQKVASAEQAREQGEFIEFSKEAERNFWQNILETQKVSAAERIELRKKVAELSLAIDKDAFDAQIAGLKAQEAAYKNNTDARLAIATDLAERMKAAYGEDSRQYAEASQHIIEIERQKQAQLLEVKLQAQDIERQRQLAEVDWAESEARLLTEVGAQTNAELLAQEQKFETQRYQIRRQALEGQLALAEADPDKNPVAIAKINAQLEQLELQHQTKMGQVRDQQVKEYMKDWTSLFATMQSGFANVLQGFLDGTQSLGSTLKGLWKAIEQSVTQTLANILARNIANAIQSKIIAAATGKSIISGHAAEAAAAAYKSAAAIPYVGWILGPIEAAAAFLAVSAFGDRISSAAGGFDIPAGINPVTQLHEREMVLPASLADVIRAQAGGSGGSGGGRAQLEIIPVGDDHGLVRVTDLAAWIRTLNANFAL